MQPVFHSEFIGIDWPVLIIGNIIMFWSLATRLNWKWIPLTEHEKLCGSKGEKYRADMRFLEMTFLKKSLNESFAAGEIDAYKTLDTLNLKVDHYSIVVFNTAKIFCT